MLLPQSVATGGHIADKSSTTGDNPFFVVDKPFPDLFANLTEHVGPIEFATVTDAGSLVTIEIPVEVVGVGITSTLGPQAALDGNTVVLRTTFDPTVDAEPVLEFELVGSSIDPGSDALQFWVSSASDMDVSPGSQVGGPQLSTGTLTALETGLVPGVTILTSDPELVIELFLDPPAALLSLTDLDPDTPFAGIRMITDAVASLPLPGPFGMDRGTPTSTATSTVSTDPDLEPDTTYVVVADGDPTTTGFTLEIDTDTDLPTSTATSTVGVTAGDNGDSPPRRPGIKLVLIGGIIVATLTAGSVWAASLRGGGEVAVDGGTGSALVNPTVEPTDPPPSSIVPASSTSSTSTTTSAPSGSSTSSTSTSSTTSVVPPPPSSDAPPVSSTASTTTSKKPPASSTTTTTAPIIVPPTTTPLPTSKGAVEPIICTGNQFDTYSSYIDIYIPSDAIGPSHAFVDPFKCAAASVSVSREIIPNGGPGKPPFPQPAPPDGKQTYRIILSATGPRTNVDVFDTVTVTVNWANP